MNIFGYILSIEEDLKYGFIRSENQGDIFFREDSFSKNIKIESLDVGQAVSLEVYDTPKGKRAKNLKVINKEVYRGLSLV